MKNIITTLLTTTLVLMTSVVFSQVKSDSLFCGTHAASDANLTRIFTEANFRINARKENRLNNYKPTKENRRLRNKTGSINKSTLSSMLFDNEVCIPVVVNVIHDGDALGTQYNPSDEQIELLISQLNAAYSENAGSIEGNQPNTGFTFFLADENGLADNAIRRFDRQDPANEYIVYGNPDIDVDDWPSFDENSSQNCESWSASDNEDVFLNTTGKDYYRLRYITRTILLPEVRLNIFLIKSCHSESGLLGLGTFPWSQNVPGTTQDSNGNTIDAPGLEGWAGLRPKKSNYGIILNTGTPIDIGSNFLSSDGINYSNFTINNNAYRNLIAHEVGHYLGLHHTFMYPDPNVISICEAISYGDLNINGEYLNQCHITGDGCCDTKWSSSWLPPLLFNRNICSFNPDDILWNPFYLNYSNNICGTDPDPFLPYDVAEHYHLHLENESVNRLNFMNYGPVNQDEPTLCGGEFFTQDQIELMHDQTNTYRGLLISAGDLLCIDPEVEPIYGCTDPIACNFTELANVNNGECYYDCCNPDCLVDINGDGLINTWDLLMLLMVFNTPCPE